MSPRYACIEEYINYCNVQQVRKIPQERHEALCPQRRQKLSIQGIKAKFLQSVGVTGQWAELGQTSGWGEAIQLLETIITKEGEMSLEL